MAGDLIKPRTLKGFRDMLPEVMIPREALIETAKEVFRNYGYSPIDTPTLEYSEILLGKGGDETDRQLYRFEDQGGRDVAMRFDLTVPLARFAAQHVGRLATPFKRYHVGLAWRGENTQRGRYREFLQCDFDTIGTESITADIETGLVIHDLFAAFGFDAFTVRFNNRKILSGLLERLDLVDDAVQVLRALDKLPKIGPEAVETELAGIGATEAQAREVLALAGLHGPNRDVLTQLPDLVAGSETGEGGVAELTAFLDGIEAVGVDEERMRLDLSIARGLDYYTGTVYETFLDDLPEIGSCCSGGRYDDLASLYSKQRLPGVGASLGVDRLLAAMEDLGLIEGRSTPAEILVTMFDADHQAEYLALAAAIRDAGHSVELYPDARKLGTQLKYADRRGHRLVVIIGETERAAETAQLKDMRTGHSVEVDLSEITVGINRLLAGD